MKAKVSGIRVSPRKMNTVAALVRGRSAVDALVILEHTPRKAAVGLRDVIKSALANAEHNDKRETGNLQLESIIVGSGGMMKRPEFRARGQVNFRKRRMSNVVVTLGETGGTDGS